MKLIWISSSEFDFHNAVSVSHCWLLCSPWVAAFVNKDEKSCLLSEAPPGRIICRHSPTVCFREKLQTLRPRRCLSQGWLCVFFAEFARLLTLTAAARSSEAWTDLSLERRSYWNIGFAGSARFCMSERLVLCPVGSAAGDLPPLKVLLRRRRINRRLASFSFWTHSRKQLKGMCHYSSV